MVELTDSKKKMMDDIKRLENAKALVLNARQYLAERKTYKVREEEQYLRQISQIQARIANTRSSMKNEEDMNRSQTWDEKRLAKKIENTQEMVINLEKYEIVFKDLTKKYQIIENSHLLIDKELAIFQKKFYHVLEKYKSVKSFSRIAILLSDKESSIQKMQHIHYKHIAKIDTKSKSSHNINLSNNNTEVSLDEIAQKLSETVSYMESQDSILFESIDSLNKLISKKEALDNQCLIFNSELEEEIRISNGILSRMETENEILKNESNTLSEELKVLQFQIDNAGIELDRICTKKRNMIEQLRKLYKERFDTISMSKSTSPEVKSLIVEQEKHWIEKQQMLEDLSYVMKQHKNLTEIVARKAVVYEELINMNSKNSISGTDSMDVLSKFYRIADRLNKTYASQLHYIIQEEQGAKNENFQIEKELEEHK